MDRIEGGTMTFRISLSRLSLAAALAAPYLIAGCGNEANTPEAQTAEQAVGVKPDKEGEKTVKTTRDVIVEKDTKVRDQKTGQVISETKESTPVKIVEEKKEVTNVKVDVGDTKTTGTPTTETPKK